MADEFFEVTPSMRDALRHSDVEREAYEIAYAVAASVLCTRTSYNRLRRFIERLDSDADVANCNSAPEVLSAMLISQAAARSLGDLQAMLEEYA